MAEPAATLGNWYATVWFWRPQIALLVNERTLFPVLLRLAPASSLMDRFPQALGHAFQAHGAPGSFVDFEVAAMVNGRYAKTASRSILGVMNEFRRLAEFNRVHQDIDNLAELARWLAQTPCGPLYGSQGSPDRELDALVARWATRLRRQQ